MKGFFVRGAALTVIVAVAGCFDLDAALPDTSDVISSELTAVAPIGFLDFVGADAVRGWSCDKDTPTQSIAVHLYFGGAAGTPGVKHVESIVADAASEAAVNTACGGGSAHRFDWTVSATVKTKLGPGSHPVYAYGINSGSGYNTLLSGSPKTLVIASDAAPIGSLDEVTATKVRGWSCDKDTPTQSIAVHLYFGGAAGTPGVKHVESIVADAASESAVNTACGGGSAHRFDWTVSATVKTKLGPGSHPVYAYGINSGSGYNTLLSGSPKTLVIADVVPIGWLDRAASDVVEGWACDKDTPAQSIPVHLYFGGQAGTPSVVHVEPVTANVASEAAVNESCGGGSAHRFRYQIPNWLKVKLGNGDYDVYPYGINTNPAYFNALLSGAPMTIHALYNEDDFVRAYGGHLQLKGRQFKHVGVNTAGLVYHTHTEAIQDLDELASAGIKSVRVFLPSNDPALGTDGIAGRLEWVLDRAWERGIRLTVALTHNYKVPIYNNDACTLDKAGQRYCPWFFVVRGDEGYYTDPYEGSWLLNKDWVWAGYKDNYLGFATKIVNKFRDHPGVLSWDIANEVKHNGGDGDALVRFFKHVADELRANDPNHLITTGMIGTWWAGLDERQKLELYSHPNIDYITVHIYEGGDDALQSADFELANRVQKPIVVEEFGFDVCLPGTPGEASDCKPNPYFFRGSPEKKDVTSFYGKMYDHPVHPADAVVLYSVQFGDDHGSGSWRHGPREQNIKICEGMTPTQCQLVRLERCGGDCVDAYKNLWRSWATELDRRNAAGAPHHEIRVAFRTFNGANYFTAEGGGGDKVVANRTVLGPWETFTLVDMNGGPLENGDPVHLRFDAGETRWFVTAEGGGGPGSTVYANRKTPREWERFIIRKAANTGGAISNNASIHLGTYKPFYVVAEGGGGGAVNADRGTAQQWETFTLLFR